MFSFSLRSVRSLLCTVLLCGAALASYASSGENTTDTNGLRQGHWVIRGFMTSLDGYKAQDIVEEGNYEDNHKQGLWKRYSPEGWLKSEITFVDNRPKGDYTIYYSNGKVEEDGAWVRNRNTGSFKRYYPNGKLQQEFEFTSTGKRNGVQKYYHENGQLELEVSVVNGKEHGMMRRYYEDGTLKEEKRMNAGILEEGSRKTYPKPGEEPEVIEMLDVADDAKTTTPTDDQPNEAMGFRPNGQNTLYNKANQTTQVGDFRNGRLWDGKWHRYNSDGILVRVEIYKAGKYVGSGVIEEE